MAKISMGSSLSLDEIWPHDARHMIQVTLLGPLFQHMNIPPARAAYRAVCGDQVGQHGWVADIAQKHGCSRLCARDSLVLKTPDGPGTRTSLRSVQLSKELLEEGLKKVLKEGLKAPTSKDISCPTLPCLHFICQPASNT